MRKIQNENLKSLQILDQIQHGVASPSGVFLLHHLLEPLLSSHMNVLDIGTTSKSAETLSVLALYTQLKPDS